MIELWHMVKRGEISKWTAWFVTLSVLAMVADLFTTIDMILVHGGRELNPIMNNIFGYVGVTVGLMLGFVVKGLIVTVVGAIFEVLHEQRFVNIHADDEALVERAAIAVQCLMILLLFVLWSAPLHNWALSY